MKTENRFTPYKRKTQGGESNPTVNNPSSENFNNQNFDNAPESGLAHNQQLNDQPAMPMPDTTGSENQQAGNPIPTTTSDFSDEHFSQVATENLPRTLYAGNLEPNTTEELLLALFGQIAPCNGCKIIQEPGNDPYAFVEFNDHASAAAALTAMNKIQVMGREMKVNWASSPGNTVVPKADTSKHFHIFVGDLSPDIEMHQLRDAFAPFGTISDVKIIKDPHTLKSKGYGFVSFIKKEEAENAIQGMNGQWIGSRTIRTNWASRKPANPQDARNQKQLSFEEVYSQSSPTNCTVYVGGILSGLSEEIIKDHFSQIHTVVEVRVFKDKGYAFVRYDTKESATNAIIKFHGSEIGNHVVKCSWGKENPDSAGGNATTQFASPVGGANAYYGAPAQMNYNYGGYGGGQQGYGVQQQYGVPAPYQQQNYYGQQQQQGYVMPQNQWPAYQGGGGGGHGY